MDTIFKVLSNLKHNGDAYLKGTFFQGELEGFEHLVEAGTLKIVPGATTVEEAQTIDAQQEAKDAAEEEGAAAVEEAQNTWGPKKDETVEVKTETEPTEPTKPEAPAAGTVGAGDVAPTDTQPVTPVVPADETGDNL